MASQTLPAGSLQQTSFSRLPSADKPSAFSRVLSSFSTQAFSTHASADEPSADKPSADRAEPPLLYRSCSPCMPRLPRRPGGHMHAAAESHSTRSHACHESSLAAVTNGFRSSIATTGCRIAPLACALSQRASAPRGNVLSQHASERATSWGLLTARRDVDASMGGDGHAFMMHAFMMPPGAGAATTPRPPRPSSEAQVAEANPPC